MDEAVNILDMHNSCLNHFLTTRNRNRLIEKQLVKLLLFLLKQNQLDHFENIYNFTTLISACETQKIDKNSS